MRTRVVNPTPEREDNPCATCGLGVPKTPTGPMSSRDRRSFFEKQVFQPYQANPSRGPRQEEPDNAEALEAAAIRRLLPETDQAKNPCFGLHVHADQVAPLVREFAGNPAGNLAHGMPPGYMSHQNASDLARYSQYLAGQVAPSTNLPSWADHKLSVARTHVGDVKHYVEHAVSGPAGNPSRAAWLAGAAAAALMVPAAAYAYRRHHASQPAPIPSIAGDACQPLHYDEDDVVSAVGELIRDGYTDPESIAGEVSAAMWPQLYGTQEQASYPPAPEDPESNRCVYENVLATARAMLTHGNPNLGPLALALNASGAWGPYPPSMNQQGARAARGSAFGGRAWKRNPAPPLPASMAAPMMAPWFPPMYGGPDPGIYKQCQDSCTEIYGYGTEAWQKCVRSQCAVTPFSRPQFQPVAPTGTVVMANPSRGGVRVAGREPHSRGMLSRRPNPGGMEATSISLAPAGFSVR